MLEGCEPVPFVSTAHPDRAREFYSLALGLRLIEETPVALVFATGSTHLRVSIVQALSPAPYTVLGWQVPHLRETLTVLQQRGVKFERFSGIAQDETGVWMSPGGHQVAWFKDPDGNLLSLTQMGGKHVPEPRY